MTTIVGIAMYQMCRYIRSDLDPSRRIFAKLMRLLPAYCVRLNGSALSTAQCTQLVALQGIRTLSVTLGNNGRV